VTARENVPGGFFVLTEYLYLTKSNFHDKLTSRTLTGKYIDSGLNKNKH